MSKSIVIAIPVLHVGGTELQTLSLTRVLRGEGYSVTVCCYYEYDKGMVQRFREAGAGVRLMGYERAQGLWHLAKGLKKLLKKIQPDIVHVQYLAPGLVPMAAARLAGVKTVFATVHQPGRIYGWKEKLFIRMASRLSTAFFCNSAAVEESWFGDSRVCDPERPSLRRHCTIYNAIDADRIGAAVQSADREGLKGALGISGRKVVGFVGRIRREKGLDLLLDALPRLLEAIPGAVLVVVGDGPDRQKLRIQTEDMKLGDHVKWLGQKTPEEVYQLYSIMDVVAVPSRFEGFGLVAAEAMAAGLPVVAAQIDGLRELFGEGPDGSLFPAEDSGALARKLAAILSDPGKADVMAREGRRIVRERFTPAAYTSSITSHYRFFTETVRGGRK